MFVRRTGRLHRLGTTAVIALGVGAIALPGTAVAAPLTVTSVPLPIPVEASFVPSVANDVSATGVVVGSVPAVSSQQNLTLHAARWQNGTFTDLNPADSQTSAAKAVNLVGDIGLDASDANSETHAYLLRGTTLTRLAPAGATYSTVYDLNELSQVLIGWSDPAGPHLGLWSRGRLTEITPPGQENVGGADNLPDAYLNTRGQVVALFRARGSGAAPEARLWQGGTFTVIGSEMRSVGALSERGDVVGARTDAAGTTQAFRWYRGTLTTLPGGPGGGTARAVNNLGQVAGNIVLANGVNHAAFWSGGRLTDLGTLGGTYSGAFDLNDFGQVVGSSSPPNLPSGYPVGHAFLWQRGTFTDLTPTPAGTDSYTATQISNTGYVTGARTIFAIPRQTTRAVAWRISAS